MRSVLQWLFMAAGLLVATAANALGNYQAYLHTKGQVPEHLVSCGKFQPPVSLQEFFNTTNRFESIQHFLTIEIALLVLALAIVAQLTLSKGLNPESSNEGQRML